MTFLYLITYLFIYFLNLFISLIELKTLIYFIIYLFFFLTYLFRPFGNLGIGIGIGIEKILFLWKCFMKNKTSMWNTLKYSFLHLVMRHQYPSVTIIHFSTISYHNSTKIPSKASIVEFFIDKFSGLTGSFRCYLEQLFCGEQVDTCFCRNGSTGDFISGVLKTH